MPTFEITLPDGRKMRARADSEADAMSGAQQWWVAHGSKETATAPAPERTDDLAQLYPSGSPMDMAPDAPLEGFARAVAQGLTFSYGDEIAAAAGSLPNLVTGGRYGKSYRDILNEQRDDEVEYTSRYPDAAAVGEAGGRLAASGVGGLGALRLLGATPSIMRTIGVGGLASAPGGALEGTGKLVNPTPGEVAREAAAGAGKAGAFGGAFAGAGGLLGRVLGPWATAAAQRLSDRGIRLTPGQLLGAGFSRAEDVAGDLPIIGAMNRARRQEGIEDLNRVAINDALDPLEPHYAVPRFGRGDAPGREMLREAHDAVGEAYDEFATRLRGSLNDPDLFNDLQTIANTLPATERNAFTNNVLHYLARADRDGTGDLAGRSIQDALSAFRAESRRYATDQAPGTYSRELSQAFSDVSEAIERNIQRYTPLDDIAGFEATNRAFANMVPVEHAAAGVGAENGVFSGAQLLSAAKATDRSARKVRTALGRRGDVQDLAEDAKSVMTPRVGNSGTAERAFMHNLPYALAAVGGAGGGLPGFAGAVGGYGAGIASQTGAAHRAFQGLATFSPQTRMLLRRAIERATGVGAPAAAVEYTGE